MSPGGPTPHGRTARRPPGDPGPDPLRARQRTSLARVTIWVTDVPFASVRTDLGVTCFPVVPLWFTVALQVPSPCRTVTASVQVTPSSYEYASAASVSAPGS